MKLGDLQREAVKDDIDKKAKELATDASLDLGMARSNLESKKDLVQRLHGRLREVEASHEVMAAVHSELNVTCKGLESELEAARKEAARVKREMNAEIEQAVRAAKKAQALKY